jgi:hypothetical protein
MGGERALLVSIYGGHRVSARGNSVEDLVKTNFSRGRRQGGPGTFVAPGRGREREREREHRHLLPPRITASPEGFGICLFCSSRHFPFRSGG